MTLVEKAKALLEGKNCDNCGTTCDKNRDVEQVCKKWTELINFAKTLFSTVRRAYPNTVRGDLVTEFAMEKPKEDLYYINPVYTKNK